jgi:hypothetical protein
MLFKGIHRHYGRVAAQLAVEPGWTPPPVAHTFVVLVNAVHKGSLTALAYAESLMPNHLVAVAVVCEDDEEERLQKQWAESGIRVPLEVLWSPYRRLVEPILRYLDDLERRWDDDLITVLIPEYVVRRWWEHLLHNQDAFQIKARLWVRRGTAVTSVPYHLD